MTSMTTNADRSDGLRWPAWCDALPAVPGGGRRAEGGLRTRGAAKASRPGAPLVSYVTVVRNAEATLERTLRSVHAQSWPNVEHVVVDGCSSDGTLGIVERYADRIDYYVSEPDGGLYDALNKAVPLARGDLICVLNADDWLTSDAAALAAGAHLAAPPGAPRLVLSAAWAVDGDQRRLWSPGRLDLGGYLTCAHICHNAVYATREAYRASGPYATQYRIAADFRWLMACVDAGVAPIVVDEPTIHFVIGGLSSDVCRHVTECVAIVRERFGSLSDTEAWGLVHALHVFRDHLGTFADTRPPHLGRFLDAVARSHAGDPDFLSALALAGLSVLQHPEDPGPPGRLTRSEKTRRSLFRRWMALRTKLRS
jgi:hypothetical protein